MKYIQNFQSKYGEFTYAPKKTSFTFDQYEEYLVRVAAKRDVLTPEIQSTASGNHQTFSGDNSTESIERNISSVQIHQIHPKANGDQSNDDDDDDSDVSINSPAIASLIKMKESATIANPMKNKPSTSTNDVDDTPAKKAKISDRSNEGESGLGIGLCDILEAKLKKDVEESSSKLKNDILVKEKCISRL